jgi:hypothetical protein
MVATRPITMTRLDSAGTAPAHPRPNQGDRCALADTLRDLDDAEVTVTPLRPSRPLFD